MLKTIIFDFDGLILDTETPEFLTWQAIYREHGAELDIHAWGQFVGGSGASDFHPVKHLEALLGRSIDQTALEMRARTNTLDAIYKQEPREGVLDFIQRAKAAGLKLLVASSSPHDWVDGHLQRLGLWDNFETVICQDDVPPGRTKPQPDLFIAARKAAGVAESEAIILEDSPNGVLAANRAGIFVVAIPNPVTSQLPMQGENLRLESISALDLEKLRMGL